MKIVLSRVFSAILAIFLLISFPLQIYAAEGLSWYTKRAPDNKQPRLDGKLSVIKKYNAAWIDEAHGDSNDEKVLYLTFDFGYENGNTERILNTLKEKGVAASFFVLAHPISANTDLILRMFNEGHAVCNHTAHHKNMANCRDKAEFFAELTELEEICKITTGFDIDKYYRPPEGSFSEENLKYATEMGYKTVFWSFAYADWDNDNQMPRDKAIKKVLDNTHNGAVILLHPTSETNADILGELIDRWRADGYEFATVKELP
ncbi:MAG: polysaccharide deacetylase family protein [Clostridia bacterium]|nr:polysaccharide deacetylase family protein [Clostridia bacterium]